MTQLNIAMDYIEDHITDDIALENVSSVTTYSKYHFGRIFYYISNIPLSKYIRNRKLSLAADELLCSNIKIIDLAIKYGYDSADSFTRAFVRYHGATPSKIRTGDAEKRVFSKLEFNIEINGGK